MKFNIFKKDDGKYLLITELDNLFKDDTSFKYSVHTAAIEAIAKQMADEFLKDKTRIDEMLGQLETKDILNRAIATLVNRIAEWQDNLHCRT